MNKLFYLFICLIVLFASSCSKQCVQCQANNKYGVLVNKSNVICDGTLNRNNFEKWYKNDFQGYTTTCVNVQ